MEPWNTSDSWSRRDYSGLGTTLQGREPVASCLHLVQVSSKKVLRSSRVRVQGFLHLLCTCVSIESKSIFFAILASGLHCNQRIFIWIDYWASTFKSYYSLSSTEKHRTNKQKGNIWESESRRPLIVAFILTSMLYIWSQNLSWVDPVWTIHSPTKWTKTWWKNPLFSPLTPMAGPQNNPLAASTGRSGASRLSLGMGRWDAGTGDTPSRASLTVIFTVKNGDPSEAGKIWNNQFFTGKVDSEVLKKLFNLKKSIFWKN